jgi:hypothetical protein
MLEKEFNDVAHLLIEQCQEIIRLNGAYKSGKLLNSFKSKMIEGKDGIHITITNTAPYAKFIDQGTFQWKGLEPSKSPVIRKYEAVDTGSKAYPFNKKGIEPINFMEPIITNMPKIVDIIGNVFTKRLQKELLIDFKKSLINK